MNDNYENNNSGTVRWGIIAVFIILSTFVISGILIAGKFVSTYNNLVDMQEEVELARANVETQMQGRLEKIPDLVSTVQASTKYKKEVYEDITEAYKALANSLDTGDLKQIGEANENLTIEVNKFLAITTKDYPELTTSQEYISLMDQIEGCVNRISIAREEYNEKVADYNKAVKHFPENILAEMFGFEEMEKFKADEAANNSNMVNFED